MESVLIQLQGLFMQTIFFYFLKGLVSKISQRSFPSRRDVSKLTCGVASHISPVLQEANTRCGDRQLCDPGS